ncbi:MAG: molybdenum cofactor biosynthesis protein MoeB, partial [Armatimonadetes bacterium OLB18]
RRPQPQVSGAENRPRSGLPGVRRLADDPPAHRLPLVLRLARLRLRPSLTSDHEIEPAELRSLLDSGGGFVLLDVREPHEFEINRIEGSRLLPLGDLPARVHELDSADEIVVYCLMGSRSADACRFLRAAGFQKVRNLRGGIRSWIDSIEPGMVKY